MALANIDALLDVMARLRDSKHGCPWDIEQSLDTIVPYTIEEAYEVADAIERDDMDDLRAELGDLLFQVVFYARLTEEAGLFAFHDIVDATIEKIVTRHPHVFGTETIKSAEEQSEAWEAHKARERQFKVDVQNTRPGVLDNVTVALPALTRAVKLQKRAARVGFDWPDIGPVMDKISEEMQEVRDELDKGSRPERIMHEIGDLLFAVSNLARHAGIDPETAMRQVNRRFERRFRGIERLLAEQGQTVEDATTEEMEVLWQQVKRDEE